MDKHILERIICNLTRTNYPVVVSDEVRTVLLKRQHNRCPITDEVIGTKGNPGVGVRVDPTQPYIDDNIELVSGYILTPDILTYQDLEDKHFGYTTLDDPTITDHH